MKEVNLRRNPEEEYFMLAVLAHKMIHTEEYEAEMFFELYKDSALGITEYTFINGQGEEIELK